MIYIPLCSCPSVPRDLITVKTPYRSPDSKAWHSHIEPNNPFESYMILLAKEQEEIKKPSLLAFFFFLATLQPRPQPQPQPQPHAALYRSLMKGALILIEYVLCTYSTPQRKKPVFKLEFQLFIFSNVHTYGTLSYSFLAAFLTCLSHVLVMLAVRFHPPLNININTTTNPTEKNFLLYRTSLDKVRYWWYDTLTCKKRVVGFFFPRVSGSILVPVTAHVQKLYG